MLGFPDDWEFVGGLGAVANQIGNAVAPAVGQALGLRWFSALKGWEIDWGRTLESRSSDGFSGLRRLGLAPFIFRVDLHEAEQAPATPDWVRGNHLPVDSVERIQNMSLAHFENRRTLA
ncbi:hypothetical protein [Rhizobium leguminosarum]|uniref:hypothetical protein n=1 Tax=Rhizobium leguminosarum TaxID=384 RepID=UPI0039658AA4